MVALLICDFTVHITGMASVSYGRWLETRHRTANKEMDAPMEDGCQCGVKMGQGLAGLTWLLCEDAEAERGPQTPFPGGD